MTAVTVLAAAKLNRAAADGGEYAQGKVFLHPKPMPLTDSGQRQVLGAWTPAAVFGKSWFLYFVLCLGILGTCFGIYIVAYKQSKLSNLVNKRAY